MCVQQLTHMGICNTLTFLESCMTLERKEKTFHPQYPARGFAWADGPLVSLALTDPGLEPLVHLRPCFPRRALYKVVPAGTPRFLQYSPKQTDHGYF